MNPLKDIIIEKIKRSGPISFEEYMEMCLYYPELGYYMREDTRIGRGGDYFTSSHLGPFFGTMLALELYEMWCTMDRPSTFTVVEIGSGMGYIPLDILTFLSKTKSQGLRDFFHALRYYIVELNPSLVNRQKQLLEAFADKVCWYHDLRDVPPFAGCVLSNELLDAFPVRLIEKDGDLYEIYVDAHQNDFIEIRAKASKDVRDYLKRFNIDLDDGYRTEVNLRIEGWLRDVSRVLQKGFILTLDYGYSTREYYKKERNRGTLLCYHKHTVNENPYENVGEQDITCHVNFSSLKVYGHELGINAVLYTNQRNFLLSLCEVMVGLLDEGEIASIMKGAKLHLVPGSLGDTHKVMIQEKGINKELDLMANRGKNWVNLL